MFNYEYWLSSPWAWIALAFQIWMLVDAIRREEWIWAILIFFFSIITALLYFFLVYRQAPAASATPLEFPGAGDRKRIRELETQIHHLDKAHHHAELGSIYLRRGELSKAEEHLRGAVERDPSDLDFKAKLGQCLHRQRRFDDGRSFLEKVYAQDPRHDYSQSAMFLAETLTRLNRKEEAMQVWKSVLEGYTYPRARVQLAELFLEQGQADRARALLQEVVADDAHAAAFQRKQDRSWVRQARRLLERMG